MSKDAQINPPSVEIFFFFYTFSSPNELEPFWGSLKDSALKSNNNSGTGGRPADNFECHSAWFLPSLEFKLLQVAAALKR